MGNTSSSRFNAEPALARTNCVCIWGVGIIMLLTTIIYAAVRGSQAWINEPGVQVNFASQNDPIPYPAVTICPIEPDITDLQPGDCEFETDLKEQNLECAKTMNVEVMVSGVSFTCVSFNDPRNANQRVLMQGSPRDELSVQAFVPPAQVPLIQDHLGVLVILHNQGDPPEHDTVRSFWAPFQAATEVYLRLTKRIYIDKSVKYFWSADQIGIVPRKNVTETAYMAEVDFQLTKMGIDVAIEYYVYNQNTWFGEVGGLACLLYFLHFITVFIFMEVVSRLYRSRYGVPPSALDVKYERS